MQKIVRPLVTPTFEAIDFGKDIYYAVKFPHKQIWLVIALWFFLLSFPLHTFMSILLMSTREFRNEFDVELNGLSFVQRMKIKTIRALREVF